MARYNVFLRARRAPHGPLHVILVRDAVLVLVCAILLSTAVLLSRGMKSIDEN